MNRHRLRLELKIRSPFLFPGTTARFGYDAAALRDGAGRVLIPADQVRGVLKHAIDDVRRAGGPVTRDEVALLFGRGSGDASAELTDSSGFEPSRGRLLFADLNAGETGRGERAVRVRIDPRTGAADPGGLFAVELVAPFGADVCFEGEAILFATEQEAARWLEAMRAARTWISAMGSMKSSGFGEVVSFHIEQVDFRPLAAAQPCAPTSACCMTYRATIDRAFLVDARREADNVFSGAEIIPGAALKGALARKLELAGQNPQADEALTHLSISHARPEGCGDPLPLSLVTVDGQSFGDALDVPRDRGALIEGRPARFATDWKSREFAAVNERLKRPSAPDLRRNTRVHVEIDAETGTALDQRLFVTSAIEPGDTSWLFHVDYSAIADPDDRDRLAFMLEDGLDGLGRTGATLSPARVGPRELPQVRPIADTEDAFAVLLVTDAVMASPDDADDAFAAYEAYWARVCPGATLANFYASQRLVGGYLARRFRIGGAYAPFWLTEAGSVFLLKEASREALGVLVRTGLPAPVVQGVQTTWQTCPFQPENGYGTIRADYDAAWRDVVSHG